MSLTTLKTKKGFTLIELMIVVAIVSLLAMFAYPAYDSSMKKARRADAKSALMGLAQAMERHFTASNTYENAAAGGTNTGAPAIYPTEAPIDGGTKFYDLRITAADGSSFTVEAQPKGGQANDGTLALDSTGAKRWKGNAGWD